MLPLSDLGYGYYRSASSAFNNPTTLTDSIHSTNEKSMEVYISSALAPPLVLIFSEPSDAQGALSMMTHAATAYYKATNIRDTLYIHNNNSQIQTIMNDRHHIIS